MIEAGVATEAEFDAIDRSTSSEMTCATCKLAIDESISPRMDLDKDPDAIARSDVYERPRAKRFSTTRSPTCYMPMEDNPRVQTHCPEGALRHSTRTASPSPRTKPISCATALFEAIIDKFYKDPTLIAYGEDNRDWGGAFAVYRGLTEALPYHRLFNAPISESAIVGTAVGYAMCGRPRDRRADVLRLHRLRGRRGVQPDGEVAGDVRRHPQDAGGAPRVGRFEVRRAAFSGLDGADARTFRASRSCFPATPYDAKGLMDCRAATAPIRWSSLRASASTTSANMFHEGGVPAGLL